MKVRTRVYPPFAIFWLFLIAAGSLTPGKELPQSGLWDYDKIIHLVFYTILAFLLAGWFGGRQPGSIWHAHPYLIAILAGIVYGIIIEALQEAFVADRYFDPWDIVANGAGCLLGSFLSFKLEGRSTNAP